MGPARQAVVVNSPPPPSQELHREELLGLHTWCYSCFLGAPEGNHVVLTPPSGPCQASGWMPTEYLGL